MQINPGTPLGCLLLTAACLWLASAALHAQPETGAPGEEQAGQVDPGQEENDAQAEERPEEDESEPIPVDVNATPSRFIPSEEVSEDLSVPFPVDI